MSLEDLFELMDAVTGKNQLVDEKKTIETVNFASRHLNGKVANHRKKDRTNKALAWDKHVRRCFMCSSKDHLARNCLKNPNLKQLKFEKDREKISREKSLWKRKKATTTT